MTQGSRLAPQWRRLRRLQKYLSYGFPPSQVSLAYSSSVAENNHYVPSGRKRYMQIVLLQYTPLVTNVGMLLTRSQVQT